MRFLPIILIILISFILNLSKISGDGDFFHHVNTGKYILENQRLPYTDSWSYTATGQPWVAHSWGMGIIYYLILNSVGETGISIFVSMWAVATVILLYKLMRLYGIRRWDATIVSILAATAIPVRWPSRPEIVTYPAVLLLLVFDKLKGKRKKIPLLFPVVIILWSVLYGSGVIMGLLILGLLGARQIIKDRFKPGAHLLYYLSILISFPAAFLNGIGAKSVLYAKDIGAVMAVQGEWGSFSSILSNSPPDYLISAQYLLLIPVIFTTLFAITVIFSLKTVLRAKFLFFLGMSIIIPFYAFRLTPLAIILTAPLLGFLLSSKKGFAQSIFRIIFCGISVIFAFLVIYSKGGVSLGQNSSYPTAIIKFLRDNNLSGKVFVNQRLGGFLSYNLHPKNTVFLDTRDDLYQGLPVYQEYIDAVLKGTNMLPTIEKYNSEIIVADYLTEGRSYKDVFYNNYWGIVYFDGRYFISIPKKQAESKNIRLLSGIDPFSTNGARPGEEELAQKIYEELLLKLPDSTELELLYYRLLFAQGRYDEMEKRLILLKPNFGPDGVLTLIAKDQYLAQIYFAKNDCGNTGIYLERLKREVGGKFIFHPGREIPSSQNQGLAFYQLICLKNREEANRYFKLFMNDPNISQLEKIKTAEQYQSLTGL